VTDRRRLTCRSHTGSVAAQTRREVAGSPQRFPQGRFAQSRRFVNVANCNTRRDKVGHAFEGVTSAAAPERLGFCALPRGWFMIKRRCRARACTLGGELP